MTMELDTGATLSIVSENTYNSLFFAGKAAKPNNSSAPFKTYTGETINIMGEIPVKVSYNNQEAELNLLVVSGDGPNLLGRDWLGKIKLNWTGIYNLQGSGNSSCQQILNKHKALFADELGTVKGTTARFHIQVDVQPKFFKARPVRYALQQKVEAELNRLEARML